MARQLTKRVIVNLLLKLPSHQPQLSKPALLLNGYSSLVTSVSQSRMLCKHVEIVDHTCKVSNYDEYLMNYRPVQRILKNTLVEILDISRADVIKIIEDYPQLKKRSRANILNNYYNLLEAGVQKDTIVNNIWLLTHENNKLIDKLNCIKALNMDNNQLVPWLCLTEKELANYVFYIQQDMRYTYNRIEYLSDKLKCSIQRLCEIIILHSFLIKIPISSIDKKLNILYEYNISNQDILKDAWVLRYSENQIRHRCELYKETGKLQIKTWAIRCPLKVISRAIQRNKVKHRLMQQYETISEYLQNKLKVDEETLNSATKKMPRTLRVNIEKLDRLINILHQNGITSDKILRHARILQFNVETVQRRIEILRKEGLVPNLAILIQAEDNFNQYVKMKIERRKFLQEHGSVENYLITTLDVDKKFLKEAITKRPSILRINIKKLIELVNLLRQNDIKGDDIISHPKIFYFSTETLGERIETLKECGISLRINLLILDQKNFNHTIRKILTKKEINVY